MTTNPANPRTAGTLEGPAAIMQLFNGAHASAALCGAIEINLFAQLAKGPEEASTVAERVKCPVRSTRILLNALAAIGLVAKEGTKYRLTPLSENYLVPGKPTHIGDFANIAGNPVMWNALGKFAEAVRSGGTVLTEHAETPKNPFWETFAKSSAAMAIPAAAAMEGLLHDWMSAKPKVRVLDIAAGSGIYGFTMAQKNPNVELTALDWPNVLVETKKWREQMGVDAKRVKYIEGNLFDVDYSGPYDLVLLSHVYHHFDPQTCLTLTRKVTKSLAPQGRVAVHDFLVDDDNPAAAMFAMTMLVWTRKGEAYSSSDYRAWLTEAGCKPPTVHPNPGMPTSFVIAEKA